MRNSALPHDAPSVRVRDTQTGYLLPVRDALWAPARMDVLFPRRCRRRRRRHLKYTLPVFALRYTYYTDC